MQLMMGFLLAGHESTTATMSACLFHPLSRPGHVEDGLADERRLSSTVEETLRLNTPFHQFRRVTTCPVEISGTALPEGANVMVKYAAANAIPELLRRFPNLRLTDESAVWKFLGGDLAFIPELRAEFTPQPG